MSLKHVWLYTGTNSEGLEKILADRRNGNVNAFIATSKSALATVRSAATRAAHHQGLKIKVVCFARAEEEESIKD